MGGRLIAPGVMRRWRSNASGARARRLGRSTTSSDPRGAMGARNDADRASTSVLAASTAIPYPKRP